MSTPNTIRFQVVWIIRARPRSTGPKSFINPRNEWRTLPTTESIEVVTFINCSDVKEGDIIDLGELSFDSTKTR